MLPSDGFLNIPHDIVDDNTDPYDCGPSEASSVHEYVMSSSSFLPSSQCQPSEETRLLESVTGQPNYLDIQRSLFIEYSTSNLASLAFPTLFPDTKGDPTSDEVVRKISEKAT